MTVGKTAKVITGAIFILIVIVFVFRFVALRGRTSAMSIDEIQAAEGIPVDVLVLEKGSISRYLDLMGEVEGIEQAEISSSLPIDIVNIVRREGERVKKGDLIIELARDRAGNSFHQYALAREAYDNAKRDAERMENMFKEGAVSEQMLEQARLNCRNANAQFQEARSMVDLVSPIDGIVTRVDAVEGKPAVPGMPLATVASTGTVRVRCMVGQDEVRLLKPGQSVRICLSSIAGSRDTGDTTACEADGEVQRVSLSADAGSKLFLAEIVADNGEGKLKPGLVASVKVLVEKTDDIITIPQDALVRRMAGDFMYLVRNGMAVMTPVTQGVSNGERATRWSSGGSSSSPTERK
ncbi:MAG: efflux RND transporter periplasmic adaptor subunit [Chitinivibrionia bacterium]|nr:efflux RND transporter periplasmic adaptor subunit [Chitinivibrionia bacterium]